MDARLQRTRSGRLPAAGARRAIAQGHSRTGEMRNHFLTYAYRRRSVLHAPHRVVTDSRGASSSAIRTRTPSCARSQGTDFVPHRKLATAVACGVRRASPSMPMTTSTLPTRCVAWCWCSIAMATSRATSETTGANPSTPARTGIAIDRQAKRLYLIDTPRNLVLVLDLDGKVIKTIGKHHNGTGTGEFDDPTDIAVNHKHVFVLDRRGTRVQVLDSGCNPLGSFDLAPRPRSAREPRRRTGHRSGRQRLREFVHWLSDSGVQGRWPIPVVFGQPGRGVGEFAFPGGLWIDSADRLYVADSGNGRVQLFQIGPDAIAPCRLGICVPL